MIKGPDRWEDTIRKFEMNDLKNPPTKGGILLVGGSNARRWTDMNVYFPGEKTINRGFGGAYLADVLYFVDRIVLPYEPKVIVVNGGGNDLGSGKSPEAVREICEAFLVKVKTTLPDTRVFYVTIPPVLKVADNPDKLAVIRKANALIEELTLSQPQLEFIDLFPQFMDAQGRPRKELFEVDGVHFTPKGYEILAALIRAKL